MMDRRTIAALALAGALGFSQAIPQSRAWTYQLFGASSDHPIVAQQEKARSGSLDALVTDAPETSHAPAASGGSDARSGEQEYPVLAPTLQDTIDELNNAVRGYREDGILSNEEAREGSCAALYAKAQPGVTLNLENQAREIYDILDRQMAYGDMLESVGCLEYLADLVRSDGVLDNREAAFVATIGAQIAQQYGLADELRESTRKLYGVD